MIPFGAYFATKTPNVFQWAGQPPPTLPLPVGTSTPSNTWFLGSTQSASKPHVDWFSRFYQQTGRPRYSVSSSRPHPAEPVMVT